MSNLLDNNDGSTALASNGIIGGPAFGFSPEWQTGAPGPGSNLLPAWSRGTAVSTYQPYKYFNHQGSDVGSGTRGDNGAFQHLGPTTTFYGYQANLFPKLPHYGFLQAADAAATSGSWTQEVNAFDNLNSWEYNDTVSIGLTASGNIGAGYGDLAAGSAEMVVAAGSAVAAGAAFAKGDIGGALMLDAGSFAMFHDAMGQFNNPDANAALDDLFNSMEDLSASASSWVESAQIKSAGLGPSALASSSVNLHYYSPTAGQTIIHLHG